MPKSADLHSIIRQDLIDRIRPKLINGWHFTSSADPQTLRIQHPELKLRYNIKIVASLPQIIIGFWTDDFFTSGDHHRLEGDINDPKVFNEIDNWIDMLLKDHGKHYKSQVINLR